MVVQTALNWLLVISLQVEAIFFTTDNLENAYLITSDNALVKLDSTGNQLFTYNQNRYGKLDQVDATNPLKLILSYPDYGTVVMLDNTLSEIGVVSLKKLGIYDYRAICFSSKDNFFWVFDEQDYKLKKIDNNGNVIVQSSDMFQQLGNSIHVIFMQEHGQYLYLSDPEQGILVFDIYGVYLEKLPFKKVKKFQLRNDQMIFLQAKNLHAYNLKTLEEKDLELPPEEKEVMDAQIESTRLYLLSKDSFKIFKF